MRSECINLVIFFLRSRSFIFQSALPVKQPETPKQENAKKKKIKYVQPNIQRLIYHNMYVKTKGKNKIS